MDHGQQWITVDVALSPLFPLGYMDRNGGQHYKLLGKLVLIVMQWYVQWYLQRLQASACYDSPGSPVSKYNRRKQWERW